METKTIGKTEFKLYTDIEEMLIPRYSKFNLYMILNQEVGSNFTDIDKHFTKLYALIKDPTKLKTQLDNFRQLIYSIQSNQSFTNMAYVCLIDSIDGVKCDDLTISGINETIAKLTELEAKEVKKKSSNLLNRPMMIWKNLTGIFSPTMN